MSNNNGTDSYKAYGKHAIVPAETGGRQKDAKESSDRALKVAAITLSSILALLVVVYFAGVLIFMDRFFPSTTIGRFDVSLMSSSDARSLLEDTLANYELTVEGEDFSLVLSAADVELSLDSEAIIANALDASNIWFWPFELFRAHDRSTFFAVSYNESGLDEMIRSVVETFNETAESPTPATIAFDENAGAYVIVPEVMGTALDADALIESIASTLSSFDDKLELTEEELLDPSIVSTNLYLELGCETANTMLTSDFGLLISGTEVARVDADLISQWITFGEDFTPTLDSDAFAEWVDELASTYTTVGSSRTYTRADGKTYTVEGGTYGWEVDAESLVTLVSEEVLSGSQEDCDIPMTASAATFTALGEADWGSYYVDVDITEQHARFYDSSGEIIWESDIVTGAAGTHDTPCGVYMLNLKSSPTLLVGRSNGVIEYETWVTFWMPFVRNSIGFHDATWQSAFGGTRYKDGYGSHGCINLPYSAAETLYSLITVGTPVVVHY